MPAIAPLDPIRLLASARSGFAKTRDSLRSDHVTLNEPSLRTYSSVMTHAFLHAAVAPRSDPTRPTLHNSARRMGRHDGRPGVDIAFTDRAGINWLRFATGQLSEIRCEAADYYGLSRPIGWDIPSDTLPAPSKAPENSAPPDETTAARDRP